jgi:ethanolamine-phosphate phospho-lyase
MRLQVLLRRVLSFFSSFGGNPVSCAIGMAVLDVLEEEQLQQHALAVGQHYRALMKGLQNEFTQIGMYGVQGYFWALRWWIMTETRIPH